VTQRLSPINGEMEMIREESFAEENTGKEMGRERV